LGAFFGYKRFYDSYYDKLNLRFYKSFKQDTILEYVEKEKPKIEEVTIDEIHDLIAESDSIRSEPVSEPIIETDDIIEDTGEMKVQKDKEVIFVNKHETKSIFKESEPEPKTEKNEVLETDGDKDELISKFREIILSILKESDEVEIENLRKRFNKRAKREFNKTTFLNIIEKMNEVERILKGRKVIGVKLSMNKLNAGASQLDIPL
jgi:hypothetical protein